MENYLFLQKKTMSKKTDQRGELRIAGVPAKKMQTLKNISDHLGTTRTQFIKQNLHLIIENFPERMRLPYDKNDVV